ncbi:hypothetical protein HT031_001951 [Scenedesmus sp. PABB004]|nr:hypothetical protein HT031_001951 [Scenedesmus sp. PABB004]
MVLGLLTAADGAVGPITWTTTPVLTTTYTWSAPTITLASTAVVVARGETATLQYTASTEATRQSSTATLAGTISVSACGANEWLDSLVFTIPGVSVTLPAVTVNRECKASATPCSVPFNFPSLAMPLPAPTTLEVSALWSAGAGGATSTDCGSTTLGIPWGTPALVGGTATISQSPTYPTWTSLYIGNWLNTPPTVGSGTSGTAPPVAPATQTLTAGSGGASSRFDFAWTTTISNLVFCMRDQQITNTIALVVDNGQAADITLSPTQAVTATLTVTGCDVPLGVTVNSVRTQTTLTWQWGHSVQALGGTSLQVPWGGGGTVPARASFQRNAASATFLLNMDISLTNPERAPLYVNSLQIMCPWMASIPLACGGVSSGLGGMGTGFVLPASATVNCPINQPVSATWGTDFSRPCSIMAQTYWNVMTEQTGLVINFASPTNWVRINDCVQWSVRCSVPTGNVHWTPAVSGGPQFAGVRLCGSDTNAPIPDQEMSIGLGGGWSGDGRSPSDCTSAVTSTCTSTLQMQNTGDTTIATNGGGTTATLQVQATPTNCPGPLPPEPSPAPPPPDAGLGYKGLQRMVPVTTVKITETAIQGAFGWTVDASATPESQAVPLGGAGSASYVVRVSRGNADDGAPVRFILGGEISLQNPYDKVLPVSGVKAVLGADKVPAACGFPSGGLPPLSTSRCTFRLLYSLGMTPGALDAEVSFPDSPTPEAATAQAPFDFAAADASAATARCALVNVSFAANAGMGLAKTRTARGPPLPVDGSQVEVCDSTEFAFDVQYSPAPPLACGAQPVLATAQVAPDAPGAAPRSSVARGGVTLTGCPGTTLEDDTPPQLKLAPLLPEGEDAVAKPRDGEAALRFRLTYTKTVDKMTEFAGQLSVANPGDAALTLDSIVVELVDSMDPARPTVAQIGARCPGDVSERAPLVVPPGGSTACTWAVKAKVGGEVVATATGPALPDPLTTPPTAVRRFSAAAAPECATLLSGLAGSALAPGGRLLAGGALDSAEVCASGTRDLEFALGPTSDAPCGKWPVVAVARLEPGAGSTASPLTASGALDVLVGGCAPGARGPGGAALGPLRVFKTRIMAWRVAKSASPPPADALTYVPGGRNLLNVSVIYSRALEPGQKLSVSGSLDVDAGEGVDAAKSRLLFVPLCDGEGCAPVEARPACNPPSGGTVACRFQADRLPVVSGVAVPLAYAPGQAWPAAARPAAYDPNLASVKRAALGRCAVLSDGQGLSGGPAGGAAAVEVLGGEPLPLGPACVNSLVRSYQLAFTGVRCGVLEPAVEFKSLAKASPVDAAAAEASARLDFSVGARGARAEYEQKLLELQLDYQGATQRVEALKMQLRQATKASAATRHAEAAECEAGAQRLALEAHAGVKQLAALEGALRGAHADQALLAQQLLAEQQGLRADEARLTVTRASCAEHLQGQRDFVSCLRRMLEHAHAGAHGTGDAASARDQGAPPHAPALGAEAGAA